MASEQGGEYSLGQEWRDCVADLLLLKADGSEEFIGVWKGL